MSKRIAFVVWTAIAAVFALVIGMAVTVDMQYKGEPFEVHNGYAVRIESPAVVIISGESGGFFMLRSDSVISAEGVNFNSAKPSFKVGHWAFSGEYFWVYAEPLSKVHLEVKAIKPVVITTTPSPIEKIINWAVVFTIVSVLWSGVNSIFFR